MKLEALFYVRDKQLYKISDNSLVSIDSLQRIEVKWSELELEEDSYNEEFLAALRENLKKLEVLQKFAFIEPVADKPLKDDTSEEAFIKAFNHCARRVKDCTNLVGMSLEAKLLHPKNFMETLAVKHEQYVYFSHDENAENNIVKY